MYESAAELLMKHLSVSVFVCMVVNAIGHLRSSNVSVREKNNQGGNLWVFFFAFFSFFLFQPLIQTHKSFQRICAGNGLIR